MLAIGYSPFNDVNLSRSHILNRENKDNSVVHNQFDNQGNNVNSDVAYNKFSDTPQGSLQNLENDTYLTNARKNTVNSVGNTNASGKSNIVTNDLFNSVDQYIEYVSGRNGMKSYSKELQEFRKTFLNIDMEVIKELKDLFFGLW